MGMITSRRGSALRVTFTSTAFSVTSVVEESSLSATVYVLASKATVTATGAWASAGERASNTAGPARAIRAIRSAVARRSVPTTPLTG